MKDMTEEKATLQVVCRLLFSLHDEQPSKNELQQFLLETDVLARLQSFSEELRQKWSVWREKDAESVDAESADQQEDASPAPARINLSKEKPLPPAENAVSETESKIAAAMPCEEAPVEHLAENDAEKNIVTAPSDEEPSPAAKSHINLQKTPMKPPHDQTIVLRVPNAMVNAFYSEKIAAEGAPSCKITRIEETKQLAELGLAYDKEAQCLSGTPRQAGEFHFTATCLLATGGSALASLALIVNHDPKSLWQDKLSDESEVFWKKDNDAQELREESGWKFVGASRRGRSHAHTGKCRDDDFALLGNHPQQWHVLAVSDGAGSSEYSREGARIAVQTASTELAAKLTEHDEALLEAVTAWEQSGQQEALAKLKQRLYAVFSPAVYAATNTIHQTSKKEQRAFRDFYATLLLAAHREINGKQFVAGYWIGDGGMAMYQAGRQTKLLGQADSGEYAGQTRFLDPAACQGEDIIQRIHCTLADSMTALVLLTDGITDPIFETERNLSSQEHWDRFWQEQIQSRLSAKPEQTAAHLLDWLSFWSPGNHDDRTIALLYNMQSVGI
ncbi:Serine/threonine protein phosphatase PrpC [Candidatus Electronema halotolerans]